MATQGTPSRYILKHSNIAGAVPDSTSLALGELAINITDGKLFYKNNSGELSTISVQFKEDVINDLYADPDLLLIQDVRLTNELDAAGDPVSNLIFDYANGNSENFGNLRGATGTGLTLLRTVDYANDLPFQDTVPPIPAEFNFNGALYAVLYGDLDPHASPPLDSPPLDSPAIEYYNNAHVWQFNADDNTWTDIGELTGAPGLTGATGIPGATGVAGPQGATGLVGSQGLTGATGPKGNIGLTGATGPAGVDGVDGVDGADGIGSGGLDDLTDVTIVSPADGQILTYDGISSPAGWVVANKSYALNFALSDETTPITSTGIVLSTRCPANFKVTSIYFSLNEVQGAVGVDGEVDILVGDNSPTLSILNAAADGQIFDNTSTTLSTFVGGSSSVTIDKDDLIEFVIAAADAASAAAGLKVYLIGEEIV